MKIMKYLLKIKNLNMFRIDNINLDKSFNTHLVKHLSEDNTELIINNDKLIHTYNILFI